VRRERERSCVAKKSGVPVTVSPPLFCYFSALLPSALADRQKEDDE
jgi:hypothetical protein